MPLTSIPGHRYGKTNTKHEWSKVPVSLLPQSIAGPEEHECGKCGLRMRYTGRIEEFSEDEGRTWFRAGDPQKAPDLKPGQRPPCRVTKGTL